MWGKQEHWRTAAVPQSPIILDESGHAGGKSAKGVDAVLLLVCCQPALP